MAISNIDKNHLDNLFKMLHINDTNANDYNSLLNIRSNYATYSKLELIAKQMNFLKSEALSIIENHNINNIVNSIKCDIRKVPGNYYFVYENDFEEKILSLIKPSDWNMCLDYKFSYAVYYDYDLNFYKTNNYSL